MVEFGSKVYQNRIKYYINRKKAVYAGAKINGLAN